MAYTSKESATRAANRYRKERDELKQQLAQNGRELTLRTPCLYILLLGIGLVMFITTEGAWQVVGILLAGLGFIGLVWLSASRMEGLLNGSSDSNDNQSPGRVQRATTAANRVRPSRNPLWFVALATAIGAVLGGWLWDDIRTSDLWFGGCLGAIVGLCVSTIIVILLWMFEDPEEEERS